MEAITIEQLTTVGGISIAATLISQLFWMTIAAAPAAKARFGPIFAVACGLVLSVIAGLTLGQGRLDLFQDGINGVLGGLAAIGIYDVTTSKAGLT